MSIMTSVVRSDKSFSCQDGTSETLTDPVHPVFAIEQMRSRLHDFSDTELETLEDELDFYAFTGIAGAYVKQLLQCN
ncbi:hypothetical protein BOA8489_02178 [Boseongicola aestuarii]|uniref:Uncharacterized protein n=1 Tax=Boseongicola aestuarii TaxID=1470561 RepID=A0A238J168_9RHOB|nr:hypothetical protein BOA8489_02178 [Boseongicola aestuarii]